MTNILKLEAAGIFLLSIFLFSYTGYSWWVYPLLLLVPDISMLGYLVNSRTGAVTYNIFHHQGLAAVVLIAGNLFEIPWLSLAGIILLGHAAMDRMFGFGLKYPDSFHHTHLGYINNRKQQ